MSTWLDLLKEAKAQPIGLALVCKCSEGADSAKRQLYSVRAAARDAGDKSYDNLSISMSPHSDDILFIYQIKEPDDEPPEGPGERSEPSNG